MKRVAVFLAVCGCYTPGAPVARRVGQTTTAAVAGRLDSVDLAASVGDGAIVVHATAHRTCTRDVINVFYVRAGYDDPQRETALDHHDSFACTSDAAALAIAVDLPSGRQLHAISDAHGNATFPVPASEPYAGRAIVRASGARCDVTYKKPLPPLVAAREAMAACDAVGELHLNIDERGYLSGIEIARDDGSLASCVGERIAGVRFRDPGDYLALPFGPHAAPPAGDGVTHVTPICALAATTADTQLLSRVLEAQDQLVVTSACDDTVELSREGDVVRLRSRAGEREMRVRDETEVPAAVARLAAALLAPQRRWSSSEPSE